MPSNLTPIDSILDQCLAWMEEGYSISEALSRFPDRREELEPLLQTAARLKRLETLRPPAAFLTGSSKRLARRLAESARPPVRELPPLPRRPVSRSPWGILNPMGAIALAIPILISVIAGGMLLARLPIPADALPVEPLEATPDPVPTEAILMEETPAEEAAPEDLTGPADGPIEDGEGTIEGVNPMDAQATQTACMGSENPAGRTLASRFEVPYAEIMGWFCQKHGFGEIIQAYMLRDESGAAVEEIFALREGGLGWSEVREAVALMADEDDK
jgi:hypothetical protein